MTNFLKNKYWVEPSSYLPNRTQLEEVFDMYRQDGTRPEDIKDEETRAKYAVWLKKNPNGLEENPKKS